jgi:microcystin degradation protein MlrC
MRVGIISIIHESNTFLARTTRLEDFKNETLLVGEDIRWKFQESHHELGGFFEGLAEAGLEAVPLLAAFAWPLGIVADEAFDAIWAMACEQIARAGKLDGILAAPHGAGVCRSHPDLDGWWLTELRKIVGPKTPILATLDPHANLSADMVAACNGLIAYRENPHVDQRERGLEAARLMARTLRGEIRPCVAAAFPALAINIERQMSFEEPIMSVKKELDSIRLQNGVLSASLIMGYPYADVAEMGSAFVVVTDGDLPQARTLASELSDWLTKNRELFRGNFVSPDEALSMAKTAPRPVGLLDMGDNMGGGGTADSTILAHLCRRSKLGRTFICLFDPESVQDAQAAGVGARLNLEMGGKLPSSPAPPLDITVKVVSFHDGYFREPQPRHGGRVDFKMGATAIVEDDCGLTLMLTSEPAFPGSLHQLISCALDPSSFDIIILKGVNAPVAAYRDICKTMIRVNTPGITTADMTLLSYSRRRRPLFPFES